MSSMVLLVIAYEVLCRSHGQYFLLTCLLFMILTQLMGIRLSVLLILGGIGFVVATGLLTADKSVSKEEMAIQMLLIALQ